MIERVMPPALRPEVSKGERKCLDCPFVARYLTYHERMMIRGGRDVRL